MFSHSQPPAVMSQLDQFIQDMDDIQRLSPASAIEVAPSDAQALLREALAEVVSLRAELARRDETARLAASRHAVVTIKHVERGPDGRILRVIETTE